MSTASTSTSGIAYYQYYISTSNTSQTGGSWTKVTTSTTSQSISTNGTRYIYFRAVNNAGTAGSVSAYQTTMIDTTYPTISFPTTSTNNQNTNNVYSVTYGASGGSISCVNLTFNNALVNTFKSINAIGTSTIKCTAISNSGNTTSTQANITTTALFESSFESLGVTNGAYRSGLLIILPADTTSGANPPTQFGPYFYATPGCYHVWYYGNNLNASVDGYKVTGGEQSLPIYSLNYVSADSNYNFSVSSNVNNLEVVLRNYSSSIISISKITIEPAPSSWCS